MAKLEITVSNQKTGRVTVHEVFEMDDPTARLLLDRLEEMVKGFDKPVQLVKTIARNGVITLDIQANTPRPPAVTHPTFEEKFRRRYALPAPQEKITP